MFSLSVKHATMALSAAFGLSCVSSSAFADTYEGSTFSDVWQAAGENPYSVLPEEKVSLSSFYSFLTDKLQRASERTVSDRSDVLPTFKKLLHPNGICLAGTWNITEATPYTGYFKQDSKGVIILRASAALSQIHRGEKRAFGIAGKFFGTEDPSHTQPLKTANFFVIDNLGGTYAENFLDTALTNDITYIDYTLENVAQTGILAAAFKAFNLGEKVLGNIVTVRQLYEISELGEAPGADIHTPHYMKIQGQAGQRNLNNDFRDDLRVGNNGGSYRFDVSVAADGIIGTPKKWQKIGFIEITADSLAEGCDHRVHFHHTNWRNDLK